MSLLTAKLNLCNVRLDCCELKRRVQARQSPNIEAPYPHGLAQRLMFFVCRLVLLFVPVLTFELLK